jgi:hypothetical protein
VRNRRSPGGFWHIATGAALCTRGASFCKEESMARDRELIEPNEGDKRYTRRTDDGEFTESQDDVGRSLRQDRRTEAETEVEKGQGDRGDRR